MQQEDRGSDSITCLPVEDLNAINSRKPVRWLHGGLRCNPEIVGCRGASNSWRLLSAHFELREIGGD